MKLALPVVVCLSLAAALNAPAQNRTITVRPVDLDVTGGWVTILPDAGCALRPFVRRTLAGVQVNTTERPFNGPRCATVAAALEKAAFLDARVGDGGRP